jgi:SAM-dependent methyltransferase
MQNHATPDPFEDTFLRMIAAAAVITAAKHGVFAALDRGASSVAALAREAGFDEPGTDVLVTALRATGYVRCGANGSIELTETARRLLAPSSSESIASFVGVLGDYHWTVMSRLGEVLRGEAPFHWHDRSADDPIWSAYLEGLFEISRGEHDGNAALVPHRDPRSLLDLGGGHGAFSMAMCRRFPELRASVLELPASARTGRAIVRREGFADRIEFRVGDALEDEWGGPVDVISAFNLLHHVSESDCARLCRQALAELRGGGVFVVGETERPEPGAAVHPAGALSGLLFHAMSGARTYTIAEMVGWLEAAGFADVAVRRNARSPWRVLLLARPEGDGNPSFPGRAGENGGDPRH